MRNNIKYLYDVDDTVFGTGYRISLIRAINKPAANQLEAFFKKRPHEIYGSSSQYAQGSRNNRPPADLDVAINNVMKVAPIVASILKRNGYVVRIDKFPTYGAAQIVVKKGRVWDTLVDLQPLTKHQTERRTTGACPVPPKFDKTSGLTIQAPNDQLRRKHSAVLEKNMPAHRRYKDSYDFVALSNDLKVSDDLKKELKLYKGMPSFDDVMTYPWKGDSSDVVANRLEKEKELPKGSLKKAARPPLTAAQKRAWVKFASAHPDINPDDINFDKNGKIVVMKGSYRK